MPTHILNIGGRKISKPNGRPGFMSLANVLSQEQLDYTQSDRVVSENDFTVLDKDVNDVTNVHSAKFINDVAGDVMTTQAPGAIYFSEPKDYNELCAGYSILSRDYAKTSVEDFVLNENGTVKCFVSLNDEAFGFAGFSAYGEVISILSQIDLPVQRMIYRVARAEFDELTESACFLISLDMPNHPPLRMVRDTERCYFNLLHRIFSDSAVIKHELEIVYRELMGEKQRRQLYRYETSFLALYEREVKRIHTEKERIYYERHPETKQKDSKNDADGVKMSTEMDEMDLYFARMGIFNKSKNSDNSNNKSDKAVEMDAMDIPNRLAFCILPLFMRAIPNMPGIVIPVFPNQPYILLGGDFACAEYDIIPRSHCKVPISQDTAKIMDVKTFLATMEQSVVNLMGTSTYSVLYESIDNSSTNDENNSGDKLESSYIQVLFSKRGERLNFTARQLHEMELMYGDDKYERKILEKAEEAGEMAAKLKQDSDTAAQTAAREEKARLDRLKASNDPEFRAKREEEAKRNLANGFKTFDIYVIEIPKNSFIGSNCIDDTFKTIIDGPAVNEDIQNAMTAMNGSKKTNIQIKKYIARASLIFVPLMQTRFTASIETMLEYSNFGRINSTNKLNVKDYKKCLMHYMYGQATMNYKNIMVPAVNAVSGALDKCTLLFNPLNSMASDLAPSLVMVGAWRNSDTF